MATIRPFQALRYSDAAGPLAELVAPPYDVIDETERARLAASRETNSIHLIRPVGEEPYKAAARLLADWRSRGLIEQEDTTAFFIYSQEFEAAGRREQRWGVLTALKLEPFDAGIVMPHERTMSGPKADRLRLVRACKTNLSPVFGLVDAPLGLAELAPTAELIAEFEDRAGVIQRMWRVTDEAAIERLEAAVADQQLFIADGHHRYETSLAYQAERRDGGRPGGDLEPYDFILCFVCSTRDEGLVVLPTHRLLSPHHEIVRDFAGLESRIATDCEITEFPDPKALWDTLASTPVEGRPTVGIVAPDGKRCFQVRPGAGATAKMAELAEALRTLDVTLLHDVILPGVPADQFRYTHDEEDAITAARTSGDLAILVPPPGVDDVLVISRAELTMPQKSTYFYPKVLTGMVFHALE